MQPSAVNRVLNLNRFVMAHLHPGGDGIAYLEALRLDFETLRLERLEALADIAATPKLARTARAMREIADDTPEYEAA